MSNTDQHLGRKIMGLLGGVLLITLALAMGLQTLWAWKSGSPLSNWHGGTMRYGDGSMLTLAFACIAGICIYSALKSERGRRDG